MNTPVSRCALVLLALIGAQLAASQTVTVTQSAPAAVPTQQQGFAGGPMANGFPGTGFPAPAAGYGGAGYPGAGGYPLGASAYGPGAYPGPPGSFASGPGYPPNPSGFGAPQGAAGNNVLDPNNPAAYSAMAGYPAGYPGAANAAPGSGFPNSLYAGPQAGFPTPAASPSLSMGAQTPASLNAAAFGFSGGFPGNADRVANQNAGTPAMQFAQPASSSPLAQGGPAGLQFGGAIGGPQYPSAYPPGPYAVPYGSNSADYSLANGANNYGAGSNGANYYGPGTNNAASGAQFGNPSNSPTSSDPQFGGISGGSQYGYPGASGPSGSSQYGFENPGNAAGGSQLGAGQFGNPNGNQQSGYPPLMSAADHAHYGMGHYGMMQGNMSPGSGSGSMPGSQFGQSTSNAALGNAQNMGTSDPFAFGSSSAAGSMPNSFQDASQMGNGAQIGSSSQGPFTSGQMLPLAMNNGVSGNMQAGSQDAELANFASRVSARSSARTGNNGVPQTSARLYAQSASSGMPVGGSSAESYSDPLLAGNFGGAAQALRRRGLPSRA